MPGGAAAPAPARGNTRNEANADKQRLKTVCITFLGVDGSTDQTYDDDEIVKSLSYAGVERYSTEFAMLTERDVDTLCYQENGAIVALRLMKRRLIVVFLSYVHDASRPTGRLADPASLDFARFQIYRVSSFDPKRGIVPFRVSEASSTGNSDLDSWKKTVKPNASAFKEFRDEAFWFRAKERFETTLKSQNLFHLIQLAFRVINRDLDEAQRGWLYKVMQDTMLCPPAKAIVTKHITDKDTRRIWSEICAHFRNSMAGEMRSQVVSTYLTSTRFHNLNWRGTQSSFILHWKEQARQHHDMSASPYTDAQLISFLNACVSGTTNLSQVYNLHMSSRKAAGNNTALPFEDYCALLLAAAQVYDSSNTNKKNPSVRREVNTHEIVFDDNTIGFYEEVPQELESYKHEFDMDTPIEHVLAYQTETASRFRGPPASKGTQRVMISSDAWRQLDDQDRAFWSRITEKGKNIIVNSVKNNSYSNNNGPPKGNRFPSRQANTHEFDSSGTSPGDTTGTSDQTPTELEVSTHQMQTKRVTFPGSQHSNKSGTYSKNDRSEVDHPKTKQGLLALATQRNEKADGIDVNQMLSQASRTKSKIERQVPNLDVKFTEITMPRSDFTPEANMHEFNFRGEGSSYQDSPDDGNSDDESDPPTDSDDLFAGVKALEDPDGAYYGEDLLALNSLPSSSTTSSEEPLIDLVTPMEQLDISALTMRESSSSSPENVSTTQATQVQPVLPKKKKSTKKVTFKGDRDDDAQYRHYSSLDFDFGDVRPLKGFGVPKKSPEKMSGRYGNVEKPQTKLKDRILPKPDGTGLHVVKDLLDPENEQQAESSVPRQDVSEAQHSNTEQISRPIMTQRQPIPNVFPDPGDIPLPGTQEYYDDLPALEDTEEIEELFTPGMVATTLIATIQDSVTSRELVLPSQTSQPLMDRGANGGVLGLTSEQVLQDEEHEPELSDEDHTDSLETVHDSDETYQEESTVADSVANTADYTRDSYAERVKKSTKAVHKDTTDDGVTTYESKGTRRRAVKTQHKGPSSGQKPKSQGPKPKKTSKKDTASQGVCSLFSPRSYIQHSSSSESNSTSDSVDALRSQAQRRKGSRNKKGSHKDFSWGKTD